MFWFEKELLLFQKGMFRFHFPSYRGMFAKTNSRNRSNIIVILTAFDSTRSISNKTKQMFNKNQQMVQTWYLDLLPHPVTSANKGLGWDSLPENLQTCNNPGGDDCILGLGWEIQGI